MTSMAAAMPIIASEFARLPTAMNVSSSIWLTSSWTRDMMLPVRFRSKNAIERLCIRLKISARMAYSSRCPTETSMRLWRYPTANCTTATAMKRATILVRPARSPESFAMYLSIAIFTIQGNVAAVPL